MPPPPPWAACCPPASPSAILLQLAILRLLAPLRRLCESVSLCTLPTPPHPLRCVISVLAFGAFRTLLAWCQPRRFRAFPSPAFALRSNVVWPPLSARPPVRRFVLGPGCHGILTLFDYCPYFYVFPRLLFLACSTLPVALSLKAPPCFAPPGLPRCTFLLRVCCCVPGLLTRSLLLLRVLLHPLLF